MNLIAYAAPLEVGEGIKAASGVDCGAGVDVSVELGAEVAVEFLGWVEGVGVGADPFDGAEMVAAVVVEGAAEGCVDAAVAPAEREDSAAEAVVEALVGDEVGFRHGLAAVEGEGPQSVLHEGAAHLVLLIVAVALGVVQGHVEMPFGAEGLTPVELEVVLAVVVGLVGVVGRAAFGVGVLAAGVVAAPVFLHLLARGIVPRHVGLLLASEGQEPQRGRAVDVGHLAEIAPELRERAVDVAVGAGVADAGVCAPVSAEESGADTEGLLVRVIHAVASGELGVGVEGRGVGEEIYGAAEGPGAVGARAGSALNLDGADTGGDVGHVDPVDAVALGVVYGHAVGCDVYAGGIGAAEADGGVAHPGAGVACCEERGGHTEEIGHIAAVVGALENILAHVGERHRR